jgi:hypothetical protein
MGKQSGTSNWTKAETEHLLSILEALLPLNPSDWEEVKTRFDAKYGKNQRALSALQRKFTTLHRTKEPTGDPNIPSPVVDAKRIRNMIDEKTDGTRGSPTNSDGGLFDVDEGEDDDDDNNEDIDFATAVGADDNNESITPITRNAVQELARLAGHADKPFFEPVVQVVHLRKKGQFYDVHLSDGMYYMIGTCAEAVSALADEEYFALYSFIKVQEFATTTLASGMKSCQLLRVENTMIPNPRRVIGNLVNISQMGPGLPEKSKSQRSPLPTSIKFGQAMRAMRGSDRKRSGSGGGGSGDDFHNIMRMMMMQQQSDREQRAADRERLIFQAEQEKVAREERARQQQLEREDRVEQAREDRKQQQQFMNLMMMQMLGGRNKRGATAMEETSDEDNNDNTTTPRKSPRGKK